MANRLNEPKRIVVMQWTHPRHGEVLETVCPTHESELLQALRTLGIGSGACDDTLGRSCIRCAVNGVPAREWLGVCKITEETPGRVI